MTENKSKYKLIVSHVTDRIQANEYRNGDRIPSINEFRSAYNLSRDTVFAGLRELVSKGIIAPNHGVGYFVKSTKIKTGHNIFLLFNELNGFKEVLFKSFMESIGSAATVDLYFHNYNRKVFETLVRDANNKYTDYIIMSGKFQGIGDLLGSISGRVFLLDHFHPELKGKYSAVYQDFEKNTYEALDSGLDLIRKYKRILMVQKEEKEPEERYDGLKAFCENHGFAHEYISETGGREIKKGDLFIVVKDEDLADLIKQTLVQPLKPGKDFGIISYNDTPLKEVLAGGITTLSTDFRLMGKTMAKLIDTKAILTIENPWQLNIRGSL
ncbi:GntR family transcriptional regulator [Dyadobacter sp. CY107]|uniref:GntR family transcriptional regulator n=1 Tax=Dyadobacter fanqingshengii TaxID=2906443 RepID=UPI001F411FA2|nr:GntR family transcriptional regulator [Dyadobacter fanqingshengii]MCF2505482.1 GntR family transcriptional regulator [Dyadobacter fanqingshengii]